MTEYGLPFQQVLIEGMGRFPVAGRAHYFDDWHNARFTPAFHLHKGLDIFADYGTPVRAPDAGVVTRFSDNPQAGGIGVSIRGSDAAMYYFGHLQERPEGLQVGQSVEVGTILGYVGDSGNARGTPHLHLEIHRGGSPAPPKPAVDRWLDEAIERAPAWVEARQKEIESQRALAVQQPAVPVPPLEAEVATPQADLPTFGSAQPILRTSARSGTYGLAGVSLILTSFLSLSIARRRKAARAGRNGRDWDEFSLIGW